MAKVSKRATNKVQASVKEIRHARVELPDEDYERLKRVSRANGLAIAAYIRQAVLRQIRRDETEEGSK